MDDFGQKRSIYTRKMTGVRGAMRQGALESFGYHFDKTSARKHFFGIGSKTGFGVMKGLGLPFTAVMAYQGYQQGGITGAAGGVMESVAWGAGIRGGLHVAKAALGSTAMGATATVGIGAAAVYGHYRMNRNIIQHAKRLQQTEFVATNISDPFGTIATIRRRSLQALHNSGMNGRIALGREAQLMSRGMY